jgi:CRISPR-associated protein Csb1
MFGVDPVFGERRGGRVDSQNLIGAVDDKARAEGDWSFVAPGEPGRAKVKGQRLSEIGHGNIAPNPVPGGVTVSAVHRIASLSLGGLERLRFGDVSPEAAALARAALAALALAGDRLAFRRPSVWLRSGCDLARESEVVGLELPGGELDVLEVSAAQALEAFHELRDQATRLGVVMAEDVIAVEPIAALRQAIEFAAAQAVAGAEE